MSKLVQGVGKYTKGKYLSKSEGKRGKEYNLWTDMLKRCYDIKRQSIQTTYKECTVSENFKNFQFFAEWCNNQIGFGNEGWQLDKDIVVRGNKMYSEDTCVFVPRQINLAIIGGNSLNEDNRKGVFFQKLSGKFKVYLSKRSKLAYLGSFVDENEASKVYKREKWLYLQSLLSEYGGFLDWRVVIALSDWKF